MLPIYAPILCSPWGSKRPGCSRHDLCLVVRLILPGAGIESPLRDDCTIKRYITSSFIYHSGTRLKCIYYSLLIATFKVEQLKRTTMSSELTCVQANVGINNLHVRFPHMSVI